ncbi:MAG: type III-B CRISPR-associated protein Cas10/Cmr2 [Deltaproteobacteria bacterium]|nr:type III-B CRISPR-associated protein Cas10/Cmr2 [Deltaproteobacteria bacterium]
MNQYLAIFQIGPVQEFIQTAKKTVDYWSGSFMLSYFCATAIHSIGETQAIFPSVSANPLFQQAKKELPWRGAGAEALRPSLPNRLLCRLKATNDEQLSQLLNSARTTVEDRWKRIQEIVWSRLPESVVSNGQFQSIWNRQVIHPLEILYTWTPWSGEASEYLKTYRQVEALMGARKASRWFGEDESEKGHKCSLCGEREALSLTPGATRSDIRREWETRMRTTRENLRYRFRQGETLCAVCTVKRLAPVFVFDKPLDTPSTSTVAVGTAVKKMLGKKNDLNFVEKVKEFRETVRKAADEAGEPRKSDPLPGNAKADGLLDVDGDWLYPEFYPKLKDALTKKKAVYGNYENIEKAEKAREKLFDAWKAEEIDSLHPGKYYAVLTADGDGMGQALGSVQNVDEHRELSAALAEFSRKHAVKVLEQDHLGYVVYFGGDEGVAFLVLEDLFKAMKALRESWQENVVPRFRSSAPTLSVGAVITHHQEGLRGVIRKAHEAIAKAKDEIKDKDGFCIILDRRSGGAVSCRSKWKLGRVDVPDLLDRLATAYRDGVLSANWLNELKQLAGAVGDPPLNLPAKDRRDWMKNATDMCASETARLMRRSCGGAEHADMVEILAAELKELNTELDDGITKNQNEGRFKDFINLMDLAQYVAKGGGR